MNARATDTTRLGRLYVPLALVEAAHGRENLRVLAEPDSIGFDYGAFAAPSPSY